MIATLAGAAVFSGLMDAFTAMGNQALGAAWPVVWSLAKIVAIVLPLLLAVGISRLAAGSLQRDSVYSLDLALRGVRLDRGRDQASAA